MTEIKRLSECELAPNLLYEIVKNENDPNCWYGCKRLKVGGLIRGPNWESALVAGGYWENYGKENEKFKFIYKSKQYQDWKDKIFVKYDKEQVYKTLYNNVKNDYDYYISVAESFKSQMDKYAEVLSSLRNKNKIWELTENTNADGEPRSSVKSENELTSTF